MEEDEDGEKLLCTAQTKSSEFISFSPHLGDGELDAIAHATFLQHQAAVCSTSSLDSILCCRREVQFSDDI